MPTRRALSSLANCGEFRLNRYHKLRLPRVKKAHARRDRTWRECILLEGFRCVAGETVGGERSNKGADGWCKDLFGKVVSSEVKHLL